MPTQERKPGSGCGRERRMTSTSTAVSGPTAWASWRMRSRVHSADPRFQVREHTWGLAEAEVAAPSAEVWRQLFDQLWQADPPACDSLLEGNGGPFRPGR